MDGIFDEHVRLENDEDLQLPKGINRSTLLRHRLNEVSIHDDRRDASTQSRNQSTFTCENLPIKRAVIIDSTWNQCKGIFNDRRLKQLKTVVLQNRLSQFWRHQKGSPRWYLSTIEGVYSCLRELSLNCRISFISLFSFVDFSCSHSSVSIGSAHKCMGFGSILSDIA